MFFAELWLACCLLQTSGSPGPAGPAGPANAAPPATPWQRVETLRALLDQKLRDQAPAIGPQLKTLDRNGRHGGADPVAEDQAPATETGAAEDDNVPTVAERYSYEVTNAFLTGQRNFSVRSHGEFVPGMGAVVSVTVPVRCDFVPPATDKANDKSDKKVAKKSEDDAEWDAVASGRQRTPTDGIWRSQSLDSLDARLPKGTLVLSPEALAALKKCALETAWRFGAKLELARGERLAVVVVAEPSPSSDQRFSSWFQPDGVSYPTFHYDRGAVGTLLASNGRLMAPEMPATKRLVILVSSEELKSYRAGDVDAGELESVASGDF